MNLFSVFLLLFLKGSLPGSVINLYCCYVTGEVLNGKWLLGKIVGITDGDTYDLLLETHKIIRVRMEGIDAPERGMPYYNVSKKYLGSLCFGKHVRLKVTGKDIHNRVLGFTYLDDGTELSHQMIRAGLAWHFLKYNSDWDLSQLEAEARDARRGLWADKNPMAPWTNRSLHRRGISTKKYFGSQP